MGFWDRNIECMPREQMQALQLKKLQATLEYVYNKSSFYREKLDSVGFKPGDLKSLTDITKIPFTDKSDFRDHYPFGMFCVPMEEVIRIHTSSGTTGKPTVIGLTRNDMLNNSNLVARIVSMAGVTSKDIAQISFNYSMFTGGHCLQSGLEMVGATVIPISCGNSRRQIMFMKDFKTTVLACSPTYAMHLSEVADNMGINIKEDLNVRIGLLGSEAFSENYRQELEKRWGFKAVENYGLSEIGGPVLCGECESRNGQHIAEDHFLVEIIDPDTLQPVPDGEKGEVVITTLTREALPVLRYRTHDIASITREPCGCGRTSARLSKIVGRTDDMMIIKGVNVFPSQIESVIVSTEGLTPNYQIIRYRKGSLEEIEIQVEVSEKVNLDTASEKIKQDLFLLLYQTLSLKPKITLLPPNTLERTGGEKAKRVIDKRNM